MAVTMMICGDTVPTKDNFAEFSAGARESLVSDSLWKEIESVDFRFYNLEVPLCDEARPIVKSGPNLMAPTATVKGICALRPDLIGLGNNHTLDQDKEGLFSTFSVLSENGVPYIGAGANLEEAAKPYIFEKDGKKIGVYNCAEHEFTIAGETRAGANPFDVFDSPDHIRALKARCDYVVVIYHGGKEHYRYPSPRVQKACRKMIEAGADLVVGQHSHCVCCEERYRGGIIVYGQGNFIFKHLENEYWQTGILVKASFGDSLETEYIPICRDGVGITRGGQDILDGFYMRSEEIQKPGFVQENYERFALSMMQEYFAYFSGNDGAVLSGAEMEKRMAKGNLHESYHKTTLPILENLFQCEAHSELFCAALHSLTKSGKYHG